MTWWRGGNFDQRSIDMLTETERISGIPIIVTQGSYSGSVDASAGTHSGGGAVDLDVDGLSRDEIGRLLLGGRIVGWALWERTPAQGFARHLHGIAVGCSDLSSAAAYQVDEYFAGRNGLLGRAPDDGPRDFPGGVGVTWEDYLAAKPQPAPFFPTSEEDTVSEVITIVNKDGQPTGKWYLYSGGVFLEPKDSSCNTAGGWHETKMSAATFDEIYNRHCRKNRLDGKTYTAL